MKLKILSLVLAIVALGASLFAQTAISFQQISVIATSTVIPTSMYVKASNHGPASTCRGRLETGAIRFRIDGTAPTSSVGELLDVGDRIEITGYTNIQNFKAIRTTSDSGLLSLTCAE